MIINCKCGKYQFDVKKSDIGLGNREVQCGICNEIWTHGNSKVIVNSGSATDPNANSNLKYKMSFASRLIIFIIIITAAIGAIDLSKNFLINAIPQFQDYFIAKEQVILQIITSLK
jgi:predicted Zn finger-like uncharacterized protein